MIEPRLVLCSGVHLPEDDARRGGRKVLELDTLGPDQNVNLALEDVAKVFASTVSPRLTDLLEIAAYVFSADCATRRGAQWSDDGLTEAWSRDFHFVIPVRDPAFWQLPQVQDVLVRVLNFLTDDQYRFEFPLLEKERLIQEYLSLGDAEDWPFHGVDRVLLFSGGLDSLAGAIQTAAAGQHLVLVSHRSNGMMNKRQQALVEQLRGRYPGRLIHVPVWVYKDKAFGREHTQRSRSFLYAALGATVAHSVRASGVRFFENGVVSLNLPMADEALRARASKTTHPLTLHWFSVLLSLVMDRDSPVDNPFVHMTKTEVVDTIASHKASDLIPHTCSCAHTGHFQSSSQWHCGTCSQCIDRRVAILAAGQAEHDPDTDYVVDVMTGPRKEGYDRNIAVDYVQHGIRLHQMSEREIATQFNTELTRAVRPAMDRSKAFECLVQTHKRHGATVFSVVSDQVRHHAGEQVLGKIDQTSLLGLVYLNKHSKPSWQRYCERIVEVLQEGLPAACKRHKPKDEPHLQELCDGVLRAGDFRLQREFPFLRWAVVMTKPDWSVGELDLLVELKYVRASKDIRPITRDIAEDITKYGDSNKNVLFVVYDPKHLIIDEATFRQDVEKRPTMMLRLIR